MDRVDKIFLAAVFLSGNLIAHAKETTPSPKVTIDLEQIAADNQTYSLINASLSEPDKILLPAGSRLVAVVNNECRNKKKNRGLENYHQKKAFLDKQAYSLELDGDVSLRELTEIAEADDCLEELSNNPRVYTTMVPNDPLFYKQDQMDAIEAAAGLDTFLAPKALTKPVVVAVIDTGASYKHPDLKANMWKDKSGKVGYDFINNDSDPDDDHSHGTHVAGLVAASWNNGVGVSGIAVKNTKIMALKAMSKDGAGTGDAVINSIHYAIKNKADIINLSLGGSGKAPAIFTALREAEAAGITVFIAAGNSGSEISETNFYFPASYAKEMSGAMTIASVDTTDRKLSSFSNFGGAYVHLAAPGSSAILSTGLHNGYVYSQGTSMATPLAAGAGALVVGWLKSRQITPTPAKVRSIMLHGATVNSNIKNKVGGGRSLNLRTLAAYLKSKYPIAR